MDYHVVVAGGGPAGASAARQAALKGLKVLLIEKQKMPRSKACAGLVSKKALEELDYPLPEDLTARKIKGVKLIDSQLNEYTRKTSRVIGRTVNRSDFDSYLVHKAREAGADIWDDCSFMGLEEEKDRLLVETSRGKITSIFLVGADGVYSKVAKKAGIRGKWNKWWDLGFTLFTDIPCHGEEEKIDPEIAELYCVSYPFSLGWLFHHGSHLNIGIGTAKLGEKKVFPLFKEWLSQLARHKNLKITDYKTKGYYLPAGGIKRPVYKGKVFLAGDAAGFVDSFSGEGIYFALKSGRYLAEEIYRGMEEGLDNIGPGYTRRCYDDFLKEFRLSLATAVILGKKVIPFQLIKYNPFLVDHIANIMENTGGYRLMLKDISLKFPGMVSRYARGVLNTK
ncbi:MAG: geranylgeranyl reductase family protein [Candidatus Syntrophonatronum acetioxidans]|uniref:Geranylgeranyl reductase family protein n=1 Tax=Candidatus Syntrophonatronum acetioxidans TaxID=1795816 RepID=A0A424YCR3_9FIRM|nr:MAG: geranylgeranyl reductase family protein [Candidatus Syntrophonatronum acetioxidans]